MVRIDGSLKGLFDMLGRLYGMEEPIRKDHMLCFAGSLQEPGCYSWSSDENYPIRTLYFPRYDHIWA